MTMTHTMSCHRRRRARQSDHSFTLSQRDLLLTTCRYYSWVLWVELYRSLSESLPQRVREGRSLKFSHFWRGAYAPISAPWLAAPLC